MCQRSSGAEQARERVMGELRVHFRPEFLNRVDDVVLFKRLTLGEIERIVDLLLDDVRRRLADLLLDDARRRLADRRLTLDLTEPARALIAREGYDPVYGARPLRRFMSQEVETRIGRAPIAGDIADGATITLDAGGDQLVVRWQEGAPAPEEVMAGAAG